MRSHLVELETRTTTLGSSPTHAAPAQALQSANRGDRIPGQRVHQAGTDRRSPRSAGSGRRISIRYLALSRNATLGERVEDVFFITTKAGEPLTDPERQQQLRERLIEVLEFKLRCHDCRVKLKRGSFAMAFNMFISFRISAIHGGQMAKVAPMDVFSALAATCSAPLSAIGCFAVGWLEPAPGLA